MADKVILTNRGVLTQQYGPAGVKKLDAALAKLIKADKARGLATKVLALDDAAAMKALKATPVEQAGDPQQNKDAVDAVYRALTPDYLVILGGPDVVPHQDLRNPMFSAGSDDDKFAWGDLPYACEAPYSRNAKDFIGPVRVVGRIPGVPGSRGLDLLLAHLKTAKDWSSRPKAGYLTYLGISAAVWKGSTRLSLQNTFGSPAALKLSPPAGPKWTNAELAALSHFINCHGAPSDFHFYGQQGNKFPEAHDASWINGKVYSGTVVAAECCYGGEIYDPADTDGQMGICLQYLSGGAYAFLGSTTIAYGPADGNGAADLLCQFFLQRVLAGASTGRAALEARQKFVQNSPLTDPADLKTIAQFNLLGDPSIQPVEKDKPHLMPLTAVAGAFGGKSVAKTMLASANAARKDRRRELQVNGARIGLSQPVAAQLAKEVPAAVRRALESLAQQAGIKTVSLGSYSVAMPKAATLSLSKGMKAIAAAPSRVHLVMGQAASGPAGAKYPAVLIAREVAGNIVGVRRLFGKIAVCPSSPARS